MDSVTPSELWSTEESCSQLATALSTCPVDDNSLQCYYGRSQPTLEVKNKIHIVEGNVPTVPSGGLLTYQHKSQTHHQIDECPSRHAIATICTTIYGLDVVPKYAKSCGSQIYFVKQC